MVTIGLRWRKGGGSSNSSTSSFPGAGRRSHSGSRPWSLRGAPSQQDHRPAANEDALLGWAPGQVVVYDYLEETRKPEFIDSESPHDSISLTCIQWNIERGYHLDGVIATLKEYDADIICLQELDVHCARSGYRNAAREIAAALGLTCVFIVEFEELFSRRRSARTQGGGWHGNAVLSRWPISGWEVVKHTHHPVDWDRDGDRLGEPRRGQRSTLCVKVDVGERQIAVYTAHLEVFCGILGRVRQFRDILRHSHQLIGAERVYEQLIFGDLNTMGHGVARLHPRLCRDTLRWRTFGSSEAAWWLKHIFSVTTSSGPKNDQLARYAKTLGEGALADLRNPHFYDPIPPLHTTLRSVRGFFQGRLDWTLVRGLRAVDHGLDNHDYRKSDHKLLWVRLEFVPSDDFVPSVESDSEAEELARLAFSDSGARKDPGPMVFEEQHTMRLLDTDFRRRTFWIFILLVAFIAFLFGMRLNSHGQR